MKSRPALSERRLPTPRLTMPQAKERALMTVDETAELIRCHPRSVWRWLQQGRFPKPYGRVGDRPVWDREAVLKHIRGEGQ